MSFDRKNPNKPKNLAVKFIYNFLSLQKQSQLGNTLAVGVGIGLIAIAGTTASLMKASKDQTNVASDEMTKKAVASAEAGVARIQDFLAKNPELGMVNHQTWATVANATSSNASTVAGTINTATGSSNSSSSSSSTCEPFGGTTTVTATDVTNEIKPDLVAQVGTVSGTEFQAQPIGSSSDTQYKLISYTPPVSAGGNGTLLVRGTYKGSSQAQLEVKFPVTKTTPPADTLPTGFLPANLWAQSFSIAGGAGTIVGNVIDSSPCYGSTAGTTWANALSGGGWTTATKFPSVTSQILKYNFPSLPGTLDSSGKFVIPSGTTSLACTTITLNPSSDTTYNYTGANNCNKVITVNISNGKTIKIYSNNTIPIVRLSSIPSTNPGKVIVYANNGVSIAGNATATGSQWKHIQYYVASGAITVSGSASTAGFIFAPNSNVKFSGTPTHQGPIWAKSFEVNGGGNGTINFTSTELNYLEVKLSSSSSFGIASPQGYNRVPIQ